jgi:hypothetical protein
MLSPADIAQPIRAILKGAKNVRVVMGQVESIDTTAKIVYTCGSEYPFDYLILAAGARHSYFGNDHWEAFAPGLKDLSDALELRRRILDSFEVAETSADPEVQRAAITFVVIGAGPTGVEMAGAISELARRTLVDDFRKIQTKRARIVLLDAAAVRQRGVWHKGPSACYRAERTTEHGWRGSRVPNRAGATLPRQASGVVRPGACLGTARQALARERGTCAVWASATVCHLDLMLRR